MEVQSDYEQDVVVAAFRTLAEAEEALRRLVEAGVKFEEAQMRPRAPGRYEVEETAGADEWHGAVRGAEIGVPAGAAVGLGVAASLLGSPLEVAVAIAGAGGVAGGMLGAFSGAVVRTHFDDDVVANYVVNDADPEAVLIVRTSASGGSTARARKLLAPRARAFLDPSLFFERP
jgi:hypothetical protein